MMNKKTIGVYDVKYDCVQFIFWDYMINTNQNQNVQWADEMQRLIGCNLLVFLTHGKHGHQARSRHSSHEVEEW